MTDDAHDLITFGQYLEGIEIEITDSCDGEAPQTMMDYWHGLLTKTDATGPHWSDVDLMDIYKVASHLIIKDVIDEGREYRNRYWGTGVARAFNIDATNFLLADYYDEGRQQQLRDLYKLVVAERRTLVIKSQGIFFKRRTAARYEAAHAPLYDADGNPSHILVAYDYLEGF